MDRERDLHGLGEETTCACRAEHAVSMDRARQEMPLLETLVKTLRADAQEISRIPHPAEFDRYFDL